jgi:RNA polymerase sigma factor (sigma-70 family)
VRDIDRVRGLVAVWRLAGADVRIDGQDRDDVVQLAFVRLLQMLDGFRGERLPQYRAAMSTCIDYTCRDFCRGRMRSEMGIGGSLDETGGEDGAEGRFDALLARLGARRQEDVEAGRMGLEDLARAMERLPSQDMRDVLRLTLEGYSSREIAGRLSLTAANVDQLRSRALRRLRPELADV